jgi:SHS2 domain-containing protein
MKKYEIVDHTADIAIKVYGKDLISIYLNSAFALFDLLCDLSKVDIRDCLLINIEGLDKEDLLIRWLNELIYKYAGERWLFKEFKIIEFKENYLKAEVKGEKYNPKKHILKAETKAATYHDVHIEKVKDLYQVQIIFDD